MRFQHNFKGLWYQFDDSGQAKFISSTRSRTLPSVSGQKFDPVTKVWKIFLDRTGLAIHDLESKTEYPNIHETCR